MIYKKFFILMLFGAGFTKFNSQIKEKKKEDLTFCLFQIHFFISLNLPSQRPMLWRFF